MSTPALATPNPLNNVLDPLSSPSASNWQTTPPSDSLERRSSRRRGSTRPVVEARMGLQPDRSPTRIPEQPRYFSLFCGQVSNASHEDTSAFTPSCSSSNPFSPYLLPPCEEEQGSASFRGCTTSLPSTNGCGALLHLRAVPKARLGVFTAKSLTDSTDESILIPLDTKYFVDLDFKVGGSGSVQLVKSSCGCERIGIGCAVCGNPIGTRFKPCKNATTGSDVGRHMNAKPSGPEGRAYWRVMKTKPSSGTRLRPLSELGSRESTAQDDSADFYVYTFFPSAVASYPPYYFPAQEATSPMSQGSPAATANAPSQTFFVDPSTSNVSQIPYSRELQGSRRPPNWPSYPSTLEDEWQPPSPVRLSFVEQIDARFSSRIASTPSNVPRGWSEIWGLEPQNQMVMPDEGEKDAWESMIEVASGR